MPSGTLSHELTVRRHRLISISYTSLLPCHGGVQTPQTTDCESLANRGLAGPLGTPVCQGVPDLEFTRLASVPVAPSPPTPFETQPDC